MLIYFDFVASFAIGVQKAGILKRKVMKKESFSMNRTVRKNSLLFLAGSGLYPLLEVLWRGYSTPPWHLPAAFVCCSSTPYAAKK